MAEIAIVVGMAWVLGLWKVFEMPQGGSVSLEMLPVIYLAIRRGLVPALVAGGLYGALILLVPNGGVFIYHPAQVIPDYPLAYAALALGALVSVPIVRSAPEAGATRPRAGAARRLGASLRSHRFALALAGAVALATTGRFVFHFLSGLIYFGSYAPEWESAWLYAITYNLLYLVPDAVFAFLALVFLVPATDLAGAAEAGHGVET